MYQSEHPFSWQALMRIMMVILTCLFVWKTFGILILITISIMLATALYPLVMLLHKKLPLLLSTLLVVLLLLIPFIILGVTIIPSFINQAPGLLNLLDTILNKSPIIPPAIRSIDFSQYLQNIGEYMLQSTTIVTGAVTSTLTLFFLSFYLIYDAKRLIALLLSIFPRDKQKNIARLLSELAEVNGQYIRGNLIISVICGVTIFMGLTLMHLPYAAPLAIFVALMDLLPLIGSTIGMIPAILIGLSISPLTAILVAVLYLVYQQIESVVLAPNIYNKALNLSPALGFLAVLIGSGLYGIVGAFLALPVAASLPAVITFVREEAADTEEEKEATTKQIRSYRKEEK